LVLAALPVEVPVSGGDPLVQDQWLPPRRAVRRPHPHARGGDRGARVTTLPPRAADASASRLGDADVPPGAPGRRRDVRVVALGGGTGLPGLRRGLTAVLSPAGGAGGRARERERLTAIVTAADDGGSSGRL